MKKTAIMIAVISAIMFSCEEQKEDIVKTPSKDGSIETILSVTHENGFDVLTTTHNIYVKNNLDKSIIRKDTLKFLGTTVQEAENSEGETKNVTVPKDYEFFITVK